MVTSLLFHKLIIADIAPGESTVHAGHNAHPLKVEQAVLLCRNAESNADLRMSSHKVRTKCQLIYVSRVVTGRRLNHIDRPGNLPPLLLPSCVAKCANSQECVYTPA